MADSGSTSGKPKQRFRSWVKGKLDRGKERKAPALHLSEPDHDDESQEHPGNRPSSRDIPAIAAAIATGSSDTPQLQRNSSTANEVPHDSSQVATQTNDNLPPLPLIRDLWNQAYDELKNQKPKLVADYESVVSRDISSVIGHTARLSGFKEERQTVMRKLLEKKLEEVKEDEWRLRFQDKEIKPKDLVESVASIINLADDYISNALSSNPYASLAWAGVSMLLPVFLNSSKQAASLKEGLEYITDLIALSGFRQRSYEQRHESDSMGKHIVISSTSLAEYQRIWQNLYIQILDFQASTVRYLSHNGILRVARDVIKWEDWDAHLQDVRNKESAFDKVYAQWKDDGEAERDQERLNITKQMHHDVASLRNAIEVAQQDKKRTALLDWLSSVDPSRYYNQAVNKSSADTGKWILEGNTFFDEWKETSNSFLWLHGKAGSGKSVLSSSIIKSLKEQNKERFDTALAFFYFSFDDRESQKVDTMLCSLIKQICSCRPIIPESLGRLGKSKDMGHRPTTTELEGILGDTISGFSQVYIFIDALDECAMENNEREYLLDSLERIHKSEHKNLHVLCTSRKEPDIAAALGSMTSSFPVVEIDLATYKNVVDHDIALHIKQKLNSFPFNTWPTDIHAEVKCTLLEKADGMFQYVACQFDDLKRHRNRDEIRRALKSLPQGLDETYNRMLQKVDTYYVEQVAMVLKWLAYSLEPLSVDQIAAILDFKEATPFDATGGSSDSEWILTKLCGLVEIGTVRSYEDTTSDSSFHSDVSQDDRSSVYFTGSDEALTHTDSSSDYLGARSVDDRKIRFIHFSVKEYLSSERVEPKKFRIAEQASHLDISKFCLTYHETLSKSFLADEDTVKKNRLWSYVAEYLTQHLDKVELDDWPQTVRDQVTDAIAAQSQSLLNLVRIFDHAFTDRSNTSGYNNFSLNLEGLLTPLAYAAITGALQTATLLIQNMSRTGELSNGPTSGLALCEAANRGFLAIVRLLLASGVDIDTPEAHFGTALQAAARQAQEDVVGFLLEKGAEVNAQGGKYGTALQAVASDGDLDIVQLLLGKGAEVNAQGGEYGTALQAAAWIGNWDVVQLLLKNGAEVNTQGGYYGTALQAAAMKNNLDMVQLLLKNGAEVNTQGGVFGTVLQAAVASDGDLDVVQLLLKEGADVNIQGGKYGTALQAAVASDSDLDIVQLLLGKGAEVNAQGGEYGTALQAAAWIGHWDVVQLLLEKGANIKIESGIFGNALQAAIAGDNMEIAGLLHSRGANIMPPGQEWEQILAKIDREMSHKPEYTKRLRKSQELGWDEYKIYRRTQQNRSRTSSDDEDW